MIINDEKGLYKINFDEKRKIAYETPVGLWTVEDYKKYHNDYVTKVGPILGGKSWAKCVDVRQYKTSDIGEEMAKHVDWMMKNGATHTAIIVESAIVKMQINKAAAGSFNQQAFTDEVEANEWLKSEGF